MTERALFTSSLFGMVFKSGLSARRSETFFLSSISSFGSSVVVVFGYPNNEFAQPKNVLFSHIVCTLVGIVFVTLFKISQDRTIFFLAVGLAVGIAVMLMMAFKITHPPAGGNTIVVMLAQDSFHFLVFPIMVGAITIIIGGIIYNRLVLKKNYPLKWL